ncbi:MAG: ABC transporter ATP-binding protein [Gammaproteobacteria bacterium]|nr:ABC transporter ATP-binding protein [Gammaproteobacteria bacterium]MYL01348.1 ABC transporter ATP-binding protein [Gammaproteobacteria bacterium]
MHPLIALEQVSRCYESNGVRAEALRSVSFQIQLGEFVAIGGPSGSGKSTLLHIIGCLDRVTKGSYRLNGREISELDATSLARLRRQVFGNILQSYNLIDSATVVENVELPGVYSGMRRQCRRDRALQLLSRLRIAERANSLPSELSGGEQQRAAIARALMNDSQVILADEPTGALDTENSDSVLQILKDVTSQGRTVVLVSHDERITACADRRIDLIDGRIVGDSFETQ